MAIDPKTQEVLNFLLLSLITREQVIKELQNVNVDRKYIKTVYKARYSNNQSKNQR